MDISTLAVVMALFAVTAVSAVWWVLNRRHQQGLFRRHGIPGPRPDLLDGNWAQLKEDRIEVMEHWIKEYGKVFGYYVGGVPHMVLTDVEMIKQCFVRNVSTFHDRPPLPICTGPFASCIIALEGDEWKKIRAVLNPCFSASKMKLMTQIMGSCADAMIEVVEDHVKKGETVEMYRVSQGLSLDVIAKCAFAWQVDCQKNPNDPLLLSIRKMFVEADDGILRHAIRFPILCKIITSLISFTSYIKTLTRIFDNVRQVIELRRKGQSPRTTDMLQMMLDAQAGILDNTNNTGERKKLMEDRHLVGNCFIFLAAGYETTATSLAFVIHLLAKYPEEQDRILKELNKVFPEKDQDLTYDGVQELKRLDMVICESLRLYPPVVLFVSRHCRQDTTIMGQFIPAEANIMVPTWHIHHDPEHWSEPFKFDPERFAEGLNGSQSAAYLPFGLGPRVCIGKRFALLEIKMALCKLIRKYRIRQCKETQDPVKLVVPTAAINPEKGISVKFEHR
ncbi:cytochrome P450 3A5 [Ixodes scapularis]|uniref:cytochrome P450 3A5 n=1 Tax=Ixodes scapularis TaxID=6945 RepID=UPI001A9F4D7F|nr:cytochrome P450 3A5 [Ixodes scapularis]